MCSRRCAGVGVGLCSGLMEVCIIKAAPLRCVHRWDEVVCTQTLSPVHVAFYAAMQKVRAPMSTAANLRRVHVHVHV